MPFDPGTGGSKQTNTSGHAVNQSAREVREKLINLGGSRVRLQSRRRSNSKAAKLDRARTRRSTTTEKMIELAVKENGGPVFHLTNFVPKEMPKVTGFTAQVAEVEVDPATGASRF